jgi:hypothetical protein
MASDASKREIWYHSNAQKYFLVTDGERREFTDEGPGLTVADKIAEQINQGAIDKRPGAPGQVLGLDAVQFLEGLELAPGV